MVSSDISCIFIHINMYTISHIWASVLHGLCIWLSSWLPCRPLPSLHTGSDYTPETGMEELKKPHWNTMLLQCMHFRFYSCYLLITTLWSSVHLAIITFFVTIESSFAVLKLDWPAIVWVVLALFTEKLPTHYIPKSKMDVNVVFLRHTVHMSQFKA